jgi:IS5 family transposase
MTSFLDKIKIVIKWVPIQTRLIYQLGNRSNAADIRAYPPLKMFKVILIQALFNLSDREMEKYSNTQNVL